MSTPREDREHFHKMLNLDQYPDFLPIAYQRAKKFIDDAHKMIDTDPELDSELHFFEYDDLAFETRLGSIYRYIVDSVAAYDPAKDEVFDSWADVVERIRQFAPLNQTDGAWLRKVEKINPATEVTELLSQIWQDEIGNGNPLDNHANIYTQVMRSVGLEFPPVGCKEYADHPDFLDSAFTAPLLQLVVSEFTQDFLPEILGMTLHFEWESVELKRHVELFSTYGIDPRFYQLHLAIDNVANGHGALATEAVRRYLAGFRDQELRQQRWRRVWDGYVAFREAGTLGTDLRAKLKSKPDVQAITARMVEPVTSRMVEMIERKAPFGSLNHGRLTGSTMNNDLFDDPRHMLAVLAADRELVIPGRPDDSKLLTLFKIGGPMYRVFIEEEQKLWREWIVSLAAQAPKRAPVAAAAPVSDIGRAADGGAPRHYKRLFLSSPAEAFRDDRRPRLRGRGAVQ